jgi:hypothetical protein
MAWIHQKPDANGLQRDASFHDLAQMPITNAHGRMTSAFDPSSNTITPCGTLRQRVMHIGVESHELFLIESVSQNIMAAGSSDSWVNPCWNTVNNCTCAQDGTDPGGLPTFILTPTTTNGTHYYGQTIPFPAGANVISFYVKANGYTGVAIGMWDNNNSTYQQGFLDLTTGQDTGAGTAMYAESLDGGWYRVWCSRTWASGASNDSNFSINIGQNAGTYTYAGDGISGILVTQPAVETGLTKPTSWISGRNAVIHSTDVSDASWGPSNLTVTANQAVDPISGLMTAALLTENTASAAHFMTQSITTINGLYICHSAYYKPTGRTWLLLNNGPTSNGCWFNCTGAGTVGSPNGIISSSGIVALTGPLAGWYRCWFVSQAGSSNNAQVYTSTGDTVYTYLGTGISCGYLANIQVEPVGLNITPYPDSANLILDAANLADATHWNGGAIIGVSSFVTDPRGGTDAFTITNGAGGIYDALFQSITTLPNNGPVLISFYIKHGNTTASAIQIYDTTANTGRGILEVVWTGNLITAINTLGSNLVPLGCGYIALQNGWYRVMALSANGIIASNANGIYIYPGQPGVQSAGNFCYGYGPQVTALAPTAYWGVNGTVGGRDTEDVYADISSISDTRVNYLGCSEQFDNGGNWIYNNTSISANAGTDPNGNMYADDLVETGTSVLQYYVATSAPVGSAGNWVFLCRIKPTGRTWCTLQMYDTGINQTVGNYFGLTGSGIVGVPAGNTPNNATITGPDSEGYYRCALFVTLIGSAYALIVTAISNGVQNATGLNASALRLFGAQLVPGTVDPGNAGYLPTQSAVTSPQTGLSTTGGSMVAVGIPYTGYANSGNYYSHVGNANFVMDGSGGGQMYRNVNAGSPISQTVDVINMAILTWSVKDDIVILYAGGLHINSAVVGQANCPLSANVQGIPIGSLFGASNYNGWVWLGYFHNRVLYPSECITLAKALENA